MPEIKPPIGLSTHAAWVELRFIDIKKAITRYKENNLPIPIEWVEEYNQIIKERRVRYGN